MKIYDIYRYSDPHKGYGYGEHVDYFVSDEDFAYPEDREVAGGQLNGEAVATAAGYESYDYTAREVSEEELREEADELRDKLNSIESTLDKASR